MKNESKTTKEELGDYVKNLPRGQAEWWYFSMQIQWMCNKIDEIKNAKD